MDQYLKTTGLHSEGAYVKVWQSWALQVSPASSHSYCEKCQQHSWQYSSIWLNRQDPRSFFPIWFWQPWKSSFHFSNHISGTSKVSTPAPSLETHSQIPSTESESPFYPWILFFGLATLQHAGATPSSMEACVVPGALYYVVQSFRSTSSDAKSVKTG